MIIKGKVTKKLFPKTSSPSDSGFKIYAFEPDSTDGLDINEYGNIAISGNIPSLISNHPYELEVTYEYKNGRSTYKVEKILTQVNATSGDEAFAYLSEILTPLQASALLSAYPDVIERVKRGEDIDLSKVKGIGEKSWKKIKPKIIEQYVNYDLITEFREYELTMNQLRKLLERYEFVDNVRKEMNRNPYACLVGCTGIGFLIADDKILRKHPHFRTSRFRLTEAISYLLSQNEINGNTYMTRDDLWVATKELVPECIEMFDLALEKSERIYYDKKDMRVARRRTYECEQSVAQMLMEFNSKTFKQKEGDDKVWWKPKWKDAEGNKIDSSQIDNKYKSIGGVQLTDDQQKVIPAVIDNNVILLQGWAGSGKSASCEALIKFLEDNHKAYILLAPTGRASAVLSSYTGRTSSTIHRALIPQGEGKFVFGKGNKLMADIAIIDEATMVDVYLLESLLSALPEYCKILFVADSAQIPSVGCGNIVQDMVRSKKFTTVTLDKVFRYGEGGLAYVATKVRKGEPYLNKDDVQVFGKNEDYVFVQSENETVVKNAVDKYTELYKSGVSVNDMVIVSCYNKGQYGTLIINNMIQSIVNPAKGRYDGTVGYTKDKVEIRFNVGDRVMQTVNNYHVKIYDPNDNDCDVECVLYNGDFGTVEEITKEGALICRFGDNLVKVSKQELNTLLLGYSVSCHKMQGDNRAHVIFVSPKAHFFMLNRNLIYVALTRAKQKLYHFGDRETVRKSLFKSENLSRKTFLEGLLRNYEK